MIMCYGNIFQVSWHEHVKEIGINRTLTCLTMT